MTTETETAFAELLDVVAATHARMVEQLADDPATLLEAHKWILSILQVAAEVNLWSDTARPRFVEIVGPYKKWGGDNADAFYCYAPDRPHPHLPGDRRTGRRGLPLAHGLRRPERRPVLRAHRRAPSTAATPAGPPHGTFDLVLSPERPSEDGVAWIKLEPDAVAAITRDYLEDPTTGLRARWHIEADDPPDTYREDDAGLARRIRAMTTWVREQASIVPLPPATPNAIDPPYPVPTTTFGWAAGDAAYAMGAFALDDDQALVIRGRSPDCVFWNMCLWNPLLHTYNYDYERVTINGAQVRVRARRVLDDRGQRRAPEAPELGVHGRALRAAASGSAGSSRPRRPEHPEVEVVPVADV